VDLGIRVTEQNPRSERVVSGVSLKDGYLLIEEYQIRSLTYRVDNQSEEPVTVTIEHARLADHALYDTPEPAETTAEWHRFPVHVEAHSVAEFTVRQRQLVARREEVRNQKLDQLRSWLRNRALDEATFERLRGLLALYDRIGEHETRLKENDKRREAILNQQKAVQGNLAALHTEGEEGKLRARYAETLNALEDRLTELRADDAAQRQAIEELKRQIEAELRAL
jgi:hypothetical protein